MLKEATLTESVKALALELGFDRVAIGPAAPPDHGPEFRRWVEVGYAGTMAYDFTAGAGVGAGSFYRLDPNRRVTKLFDGVFIGCELKPLTKAGLR